ncbi:hypothetical protein ABZY05_46860 [Streptomyces canus]|uniref:hypothetical protein n=1 Tax=Streptomyces canus TaxID=58343 RepID=UPI0033A89AA0
MANFAFFSQILSLNTALDTGEGVPISTGILADDRSGLQVLVTAYAWQTQPERVYVVNVSNVNMVTNTGGGKINLNYRLTNLTANHQPVKHFRLNYLAIWP